MFELLLLLLIMYFQSPGFLQNNLPVTLSQKIEENPGLAVGILYALLPTLLKLTKNIEEKILYFTFLWVFFIGYIGILHYPRVYDNAHFFYSINAFAAAFAITLCAYNSKKSLPLFSFLFNVICFVLLILCYFFFENGLGILEILFVLTTLNCWTIIGTNYIDPWKIIFLG
jgi:hypothetical protein